MRRLLLGSAALAALGASLPATAADMAVKAVQAPPPVIYNWGGCHIGGDIGGAWVRDALKETVTTTGVLSAFTPNTTGTPSGVKLGGYIGCDWQVSGAFVAGLEGDAEWANIGGSAVAYANTGTPADTYEAKIRSQGSFRGRLGYAAGPALLYATGGVAFAQIDHVYTLGGSFTPETFSNTRAGWTLGAGVDYMFTSNWIGRLEYRYSDFGTQVNVPAVTFTGFTESHRITENAVRAGIAYKFDAPLVAKY